jgi:hypothetical protein
MNMGKTDRIIRAILGIVALLVAFLWVGGVLQIVLWIIGGIMLLTAIVGFCPAYALFRLSTKSKH